MKKRNLIGTTSAIIVIISMGLPAKADVLWECPKTYTMSSKVGISERFNGTDYVRYVEGKFICDMKGPDSNECYFKYQNVMEGDGAVVGFYRQKNYPKDTQIIVLDINNRKFYKTFEQGDLKVTIFGDCQRIGENRLQVSRTRKDDAFALLGATVFVPEIAAFCNRQVGKNDALIAAAANWNERNRQVMKKIVQVLESEGGLSERENQAIDKMAYLMIKNEVDRSGDKAGYCADAVDIINAGQLDLDSMEDLKVPLARVMGK